MNRLSILIGLLIVFLLVLPLISCAAVAAPQTASTNMATFNPNWLPAEIVSTTSIPTTMPYQKVSILEPETWIAFNNYDEGYSFQHPQTFSVKFDINPGGWLSISDDQNAIVMNVSRIYNNLPGSTTSTWVDKAAEQFKGFYNFQVISRTDLMWQGLYPASEWTYLVQGCEDIPPVIKEKHIYIMKDGYIYQVNAWAAESKYQNYSSIYDSTLASFCLIP
jgi:hypothetical protein